MKYRAVIETIEIDPDTGEKIGEARTNTIERFIEAQTVYGGDVGLKLYIKNGTCNSSASRQLSIYKEIQINQHLCFEKKSKRTRKF